ncbi:GNAT family N-acetyltransferase [Niveibacterium sp. SC-1]|uniref:GNAT family N-acetyltransferase n=1 Tax=Niveibacterium sp. SC-1 TaxID=3135646 RepID=UPI00311EEB18
MQSRIYNIHAYPTHLIHSVPLRRGCRATLRPVLPQDATLERDFVAGLSPASRRNRFHGNVNGLSDRFAEQITCVDYVHQMGFVVTMLNQGEERVIADACYVLDDDGDTAEFAVAVSDDWQGIGLGMQLVGALCNAARSVGARWLYGEVLKSNARMLALMLRCGFTVRPHPADESLVRVERGVSALVPEPRIRRRAARVFSTLSHALPDWIRQRSVHEHAWEADLAESGGAI